MGKRKEPPAAAIGDADSPPESSSGPHQPPAAPQESALPAQPKEEGEKEGVAAAAADDRISKLPDELLAFIVSLLPIKQSAATSVLSSRWRHLWTSAPLNIVDYDVADIDNEDGWHILSIIDAIVCRHCGPVKHFCIRPQTFHCSLATPNGGDNIIHMWIEKMAERGLKSISLHHHDLPPRVLTCQSLRSLRLFYCDPEGCKMFYCDNLKLKLPALPPNLTELILSSHFCKEMLDLPPCAVNCKSLCSLVLTNYIVEEPSGGRVQMPPNLSELRLSECDVTDRWLSGVLSTCKSLDTLELLACYGLKNVQISSSSLRKLTLKLSKNSSYEYPQHILIKDVPNLEVLLYGQYRQIPVPSVNPLSLVSTVRVVGAQNLQILGHVNARTKMLQLENIHIQDGSLTNSGTHIHSLRKLILTVGLDDARQTKLLADMLRCIPSLQSLEIELSEEFTDVAVDEEYWEQESPFECVDHHLEVVKLKRFSGLSNHLRFARFLIRSARMLRAISFERMPRGEKRCVEAIKGDLDIHTRASVDVKVMVT